MGLIGRGLDILERGLDTAEQLSPKKQIEKERKIRQKAAKPYTLIMAEILLLIISSVYICKICILACGFYNGFGDRTLSLLMYIFEIAMLFIAVRGLLGISSRKPGSWGAVVRGGVAMMIMGIMTLIFSVPLSASSLVNIDVWYAAVLTIPLIALMCKKSVREYYTPPMMECRPLKYWILTCVGMKLYPGSKYRLSYEN